QTIDPLSPNLPTAPASADATVQVVDGNGHVTTQVLDQRGQRLSSFDEVGSLGSVTRDANGFVVQRTNGLGDQTRYAYDARGNLTSTWDSLSGPFRPQQDLFVGVSSAGVPFLVGTAVGDVNGDGAPDVVAVTSDGKGSVLRNVTRAGKPTGTF